ncbi:four-helix bundle copper-binding protein [Achromobacter ruhlandii]|uniref:four-helix bundle copper-binding protein n=1 Tax=Achromobacter ruhlandii TaxID=72557 RepID=UPI0030BA08BC
MHRGLPGLLPDLPGRSDGPLPGGGRTTRRAGPFPPHDGLRGNVSDIGAHDAAGRRNHAQVCNVCAFACRACAASCDAIKGMRACADTCRACAQACERMRG